MDITPISKEAFAVLAECEETRKPFGITIDPLTKCQTPCDKITLQYAQIKRNGPSPFYSWSHVASFYILI